MKINLWYSKSMHQWRWTLCEEFKNGVTKLEQHSGQQDDLRHAMDDVANTVEYILEKIIPLPIMFEAIFVTVNLLTSVEPV